MPEPLKLFISYRSSDAPKVDKIARDLALLKHEDGTPRYAPWQDKHNLPPASPHWWDAIVDAIDECPAFVFHISEASLKSAVCQAELEYAHRRNRPIIPIVLEGEFFLNDVSGKYDLPKDSWAHVPAWLGERQFLFYTGADFYRQFEMAMDVFRRAWPRAIPAPRPMNPDLTDGTTNHARYDQACDFAERLAFAEAEKLFDALARRNDSIYGEVAVEWLELLRLYAELIEVDSRPRARFTFKPLWEKYVALFPKAFADDETWIFDPKGFAHKGSGKTPATPALMDKPSPTPVQGLTAEEYYERGNERRNQRLFDVAIEDYTEAIKLNPHFAEAYAKRSGSYYYKGDYDRGIVDANEAIRLNPQYAEAYTNRGVNYASKGNTDQAISDYNEAIRLNPHYGLAYYNRGLSYTTKGDYDRAISDYERVLQIDPDHKQSAFHLQIAIQARMANLRSTLAKSMRAEEYFERAEVRREQRLFDLAIEDYTEGIKLNPRYAEAYHMRGYTYDDKKDYDRAIADYTEAIRLNPQYAEAYNNRGNSYAAQGDIDRAIADYTEAIRLNDQYVLAYFNRGISYDDKRDYGKAIADYTKAIRLDPRDADTYIYRGISYKDKGDYDGAIADFNEAIRLNPQYADAFYNRGLFYSNIKKDYDRAIADYDRALQIDPKHKLAASNRKKAIEAKKKQGR